LAKLFTTELLATGFSFLEGPRWHDGQLWVSDMRGGAVYRVDRRGASSRVAEVPSWPSGLGFLPDGTPVVVGMHDKTVYRIGTEGFSVHGDLGGLVTAPLNDMVVTPEGRCYVGDIGYDFYANAPSAPGGITLIDSDGSARRLVFDMRCPNGMLVRTDGRTLCAAESFGHRLVEFDVGATGDLANPRVLVELPGEVPDGICLDAEGAIWVACYMGRRFVRVDRAGRITGEVKVPGRNAVACQLADDGTLFCLTYTKSFEDMAAGVPGSQIEVAQVEVPAAGSP
jgi:sugar lactone lactonase YvrE